MSTPVKTIEDLWGYLKRLRFVRNVIDQSFRGVARANVSVLDIGCGNGSQLAIQLALDGFQVIGIDTDEASIKQARLLSAELPNTSFQCTSVSDFNSSRPFDVLILSEVLEHTTDPSAMLAASLRHLAGSGIVIVTVPNGYGEFEIDSWIYRNLGLGHLARLLHRNEQRELAATENQESGHVQFFTRQRLNQLFAQCGLEVFSEGAGSLLAGPMIAHSLGHSRRFVEWNARITDQLPLGLASGWYFALRSKR